MIAVNFIRILDRIKFYFVLLRLRFDDTADPFNNTFRIHARDKTDIKGEFAEIRHHIDFIPALNPCDNSHQTAYHALRRLGLGDWDHPLALPRAVKVDYE